jgi:cell division protein FtsI/penicillin-binding protein 2
MKRNTNIAHFFILFVNLILWVLPLFYLFKLQVLDAAKNKKIVETFETTRTLLPRRGDIYVQDKNGKLYLIATTQKIYDVYFNPTKTKDLNSELNKIKTILNIDIPTKINNSSFIIAKNVDETVVKELKKLKLDSLFFEEKYKRVYLENNFLSTILGFTISDENGILKGVYGLEQYYDEFLRGEPGLYYGIGEIQTPIPGSDLILNIDYFIQKYAERVLEEGIKEFQAEGGLIVVTTNDGKILAVAEKPNYNPNEYNKVTNQKIYLTRLTQNYEPGSVLKSLTFFAGLDSKVYSPENKYFDAGYVEANQWKIYNFDKKGRGYITLQEAFEQSLNTGAIYIEKLLGHNRFLSYLKEFRFNQKPLIDLPNLSEGNIKNLEKSSRDLRDVNFYTASFGHGISISPAHLLMLFNTFANDGDMFNLLLVDRIISYNQTIKQQKTMKVGHIGNKEAYQKFKDLLEKVTLNGSGKKARTLGFRIGGKTGSAYIPFEDKPGYSNEVINSYVVIFPLSKPRFIILVRIDKPNQGLAMVTTVPLAKKMIDFLINYYNIPPDNEKEIFEYYSTNSQN